MLKGLFSGGIHKICKHVFSFVNSLLINDGNVTSVNTFNNSLEQHVLKSNYI